LHVSLDTKIGHIGDVLPSQSLNTVMKKLNLTQQMRTCTNKLEDIVTQNINKALKPGLVTLYKCHYY